MQHFQSILIAIGILAITGVLIHGFLVNRKEKLALKELEEDQYESQHIDDELQDVEISEPIITNKRDLDSVAFSTEQQEKEAPQEFNFNFNEDEPLDTPLNTASEELSHDIASDEMPEELIKDKVKPDVITEIPVKEFNLVDKPSTIEQQYTEKNEDEYTQKNEDVELFIFNVASRGEERLGGHELLQFFLTSGFRFGEMNIFHRHEHSDGTGEVLFSIANMMAPGTFDLDSIEQFNSPGISFFLTAPNTKISVKKSFDMMLRAVEQVAEEFDCEVLNEQRELFTPEQFHEYQTRLKKYE